MRGDRELITAVLTKVKVELPSAATRSVGVMYGRGRVRAVHRPVQS